LQTPLAQRRRRWSAGQIKYWDSRRMLRQKEGETEDEEGKVSVQFHLQRLDGFGLNSAAPGGLKSRPTWCKPKPMPVSPRNALHASFCCCRETLHGLPHEEEQNAEKLCTIFLLSWPCLACPLFLLACCNILHCTCTLIDFYVPGTAALPTLFLF
jgi:hypothetical protein